MRRFFCVALHFDVKLFCRHFFLRCCIGGTLFFGGGAGEVAAKALKLKRRAVSLRAQRVARRKRPRRRFCFFCIKLKSAVAAHVKRNASKKHVKRNARKKNISAANQVEVLLAKGILGQSAPFFFPEGFLGGYVRGGEWNFGQYVGHAFAGGRPLAAFYIAVFLFWLK